MAQLYEELTSAELTEWMAFAELEPFGGPVDDLRAGLGPAVAINMNRGEEGEPVSALAFYPWHNPKPDDGPQTPEQIAARLRAILTPTEEESDGD